MGEGTCWKIKWNLFRLKMHYFLFFSGLGGVEPYKALIGKGIGISASSIGLIITVSLLLTFVLKPIAGYFTNYYEVLKSFCICMLLTVIVSSLSILYLPKIESTVYEALDVHSLNKSSFEEINSTLKKFQDFNTSESNFTSPDDSHTILNHQEAANFSQAQLFNGTDFFTSIKTTTSDELSFTLSHHISGTIAAVNDTYNTLLESTTTESPINVYQTYQFWVFFSAIILLHVASCNVSYLSDVICYDILENKKEQYGRQRLWGTIGWAVICFLSGYLNDLTTGSNPETDFSPGFYIMICAILLDIATFFTLPVRTIPFNGNNKKDLRKVFSSCKIITFVIGGGLMGIFMSFVSYFEFWYLQDLGASQTLLGSTIFVQCLCGEVPFFIISGWLVEKIGCFNGLLLAFLGYSLRFFLYFIIHNPWWALGIDLTHGLTFSIWHTSMTSFASKSSPAGLEGAVFGVFDGVTYSLGTAIGSTLAGVGIDVLGGRKTTGMFSLTALACTISFWTVDKLRQKRRKFKSVSLIDINK